MHPDERLLVTYVLSLCIMNKGQCIDLFKCSCLLLKRWGEKDTDQEGPLSFP